MFAAAAGLLGVAAHLASGGTAPPAPTLLLAAVLLAPLSWLLAGRERGLPALTAATLGAQAALHGLFAALPGRASLSWADLTLCHAPGARLPAHPIGIVLRTAPSPALLHGVAALVAHAGAALVLAWWLRRGEAAAWALLRQVAVGVLTRLLPVLPVGSLAAGDRTITPGPAAPRPVSAVAGLLRRGPPAAFAAA